MSSELAQRAEHETSRSSAVDEKTASVTIVTDIPSQSESYHRCFCAHCSPLSARACQRTITDIKVATEARRNHKPDHLDLTSSAIEDESSAATTDSSKKNNGLLLVPSRSSSRKVQPSPTSTGNLSGVTASDPSGSIGGGSRDSTASIGKKRNGSVDSSKKSAAQPAASGKKQDEVNATSAQSAPMPKSKKSRGFLSFLNCCGVPDNANGVDSEEAIPPAKQVAAVPQSTRATTASKPAAGNSEVKTAQKPTESDQVVMTAKDEPHQLNEKTGSEGQATGTENAEMHPAAPLAQGSDMSANYTSNQPLPAIPTDTEKKKVESDAHLKTNPTVFVEAPTPNLDHDANDGEVLSAEAKSGGDSSTEQGANPSESAQKREADVADVQTSNNALPPPPPLPEIGSNAKGNPSSSPPEAALAEAGEEKHQWLLPPITARFKGKKCLVLDLDETLVHSSFKVIIPKAQRFIGTPVNSRFRYSIKQTSRSQSRLKGHTTMFMSSRGQEWTNS